MIKKIVLFILLAACMTAIFIFSSQTGKISGNISGSITEWIAQKIVSDFDQMTHPEQINMVESMHFYIRKLAHFSIYALLGFLSFLNICQYSVNKKVRTLIPPLFCLLYACSDEFHQLFTDGRSGNPFDVMIDFSGAVLGIIISAAVSSIFLRLKQNKKSY